MTILLNTLLLLATPVFVLFLYGFNLFWYCSGKKQLPPGSMGLPFLGETLHFLYYKLLNRPHDFAQARRERYGNLFKTHLFGKPYIFSSGARGAKMIMTNENKSLISTGLGKLSSILGPHSLLLIHGERHRILKNIFKDTFTPDGVANHAILINNVAIDILKRWKEGELYLLENEVTKYTFNIMMLLICGWNASPITSYISELTLHLVKAVSCVPINFPGFQYYEALQTRKKLITIFQTELNRRRLSRVLKCSSDSKPKDLLDAMISAKVMSDDEIIDNLINFIVAGEETTTSTLLFLLKYLGENQSALNAIEMENKNLEQLKNSTMEPFKWEDLRELQCLDKVIKEATRVSTPISWWHREVVQDTQYDGYTYPKHWRLIFDSRGTHDSPGLFPLPYEFDHERFNMPMEPYTCLPFGVGPNTCLGTNLAKLTMSTFVFYLTTNFKWKSVMPYAKVDYTSFTRPKGGVPIFIEEKFSSCMRTFTF